MGTDITAEIHVLKNNFWKECRNQDCLDTVNKQSYEFFALLAGVRNEEFEFIPIVKEPKGLPEDIQRKLDAYGFEYEWNGAEWGISWVTLQEILSDPCLSLKHSENYLFKEIVPCLMRLAKMENVTFEQIRIVYGFFKNAIFVKKKIGELYVRTWEKRAGQSGKRRKSAFH